MARTRRLLWVLRVGAVLATFMMAMIALRGGVGLTQRAHTVDASVWTHTYYAVGLFVLGGLDIGVPTGGPHALRLMLWGVYFLAPAITTSAVVEGAIRLLRPDGLRRLALRDHVVVIGLGQLGMMFLEALREQRPEVPVLVVERDANNANLDIVRERFGALTVIGDARNQVTFEAMQLKHARAVMSLTDDGLVNLDVGWRVVRSTALPAVAHVGDIAMRRLVERASRGEALERLRVFNSHRVAACGLHEQHLAALFEQTAPKDVVVLAGFGRFGQTILEHLLREARGEIERAVVVDLSAHRAVRSFRAQVEGVPECSLETVEGDLDDPRTWDAVDQIIEDLDVEPIYVIGTDDDARNLRAGISLRGLRNDSRIFIRITSQSAFVAEVSAELEFTVLSVNAMLRKTMMDRVDEWIGENS